MYLSYYGLDQKPFQLTPDPRFFFGSSMHRRAMATLSYGLSKNEGFIVITGEVGSGKTTMIDYILSRLRPEEVSVAKVNTTQLDGDTLLEMIAWEFGVKDESNRKSTLLRNIFKKLGEIKETAFPIVIVDEVQNLPFDALEELRMLSNYQASDGSTLQIILVGQPQFRKKLLLPDYAQIQQRVVSSFHLHALNEDETKEYISHRLRCAGRERTVFDERAATRIYRFAQGMPRQINLFCERLLLYGYLENKLELNKQDVDIIAQELADETGLSETAAQTKTANGTGEPRTEAKDQEDLLWEITNAKEALSEFSGDLQRRRDGIAKRAAHLSQLVAKGPSQ